jgi:flagellar basal-body rod protein FlgB
MQLFDLTHVGLERALQGAAVRQAAIADNIANVDTPGYRRRDVDFQSALRDAFADGRDAVDGLRFSAELDGSAPVRLDGSTVDVDREASAQARNGMTYQALTSVLKAREDILRSAIGVA